MEIALGVNTLSIECGKVAKQANGSRSGQASGDTVVLATACSSEPREGIDFFPLILPIIEEAIETVKALVEVNVRASRHSPGIPLPGASQRGRAVNRLPRPIRFRAGLSGMSQSAKNNPSAMLVTAQTRMAVREPSQGSTTKPIPTDPRMDPTVSAAYNPPTLARFPRSNGLLG